MPLVNMKELLEKAQQGGYAVGSFSVANMEMVVGIVRAAEKMRAPVILQIAEVRLKHSPLEIIGPMMIAAAENATVPVAVHLDHGTSLECIERALDIGFTSVMFDGSHLPVEENIAITKKVKALADQYGASTEAEIGCVGGSEDGSVDIAMRCTSPEQALHFWRETQVDALAIAIGNAHGFYKEAPELRFDILEAVAERVPVPLVLHGGTGIEPEDFIKCHQKGIRKINIATATFAAAEGKVRQAYEKGEIKGYYDLHQKEIEGALENAQKHIEIFYSQNKAE